MNRVLRYVIIWHEDMGSPAVTGCKVCLVSLKFWRLSTVGFCKWLLFKCLGFGSVLGLLILQETKHTLCRL